jgi:hypothetical protein
MRTFHLVQEYVGGPLLRIVRWLDEGRVALCEFVHILVGPIGRRICPTGKLKQIAAASLIVVGIVLSAAHGHPPEDPPNDPDIQRIVDAEAGLGTGGPVMPFTW